MKLKAAGKTDLGTMRDLNEDFIGMDLRSGVFVAADGMGGHSAGEVASRLLVDAVLEFFQGAFRTGLAGKIDTLIRNSIEDANARIYALSGSDPDKMGMGTTAAVLVFFNRNYHVGWVGDSRLYLFRDGTLKQVTRDHSAVQTLVSAGMITEDEAMKHPQRNVITRAVGVEPLVDVDVLSGTARAGDVFFICTDGVSGVISPPDLEKILKGNDDIDAASSCIIQMANEQSGRDNSSVILVRIESL